MEECANVICKEFVTVLTECCATPPKETDTLQYCLQLHVIANNNNLNYFEMMKYFFDAVEQQQEGMTCKMLTELLRGLHFGFDLIGMVLTPAELGKRPFCVSILYQTYPKVIDYMDAENICDTVIHAFQTNKDLAISLIKKFVIPKSETLKVMKSIDCTGIIRYMPYVHCFPDIFFVMKENFKNYFADLYCAFCTYGELCKAQNGVFDARHFSNMTIKNDVVFRNALYATIPEIHSSAEIEIKRYLKKISFGAELKPEQIKDLKAIVHCDPKRVLNYLIETILAYPNFVSTVVRLVSELDEWEVDLMNYQICCELSRTICEMHDTIIQLKNLEGLDGELVEMALKQANTALLKERSDIATICQYFGSVCGYKEKTFERVYWCIDNINFGEWEIIIIENLLDNVPEALLVKKVIEEKRLCHFVKIMEFVMNMGNWTEWYDRCSLLERRLISLAKNITTETKSALIQEVKEMGKSIRKEVVWSLLRTAVQTSMITSFSWKPLMGVIQNEDENECIVRAKIWELFWELQSQDFGMSETEIKELAELQRKCDDEIEKSGMDVVNDELVQKIELYKRRERNEIILQNVFEKLKDMMRGNSEGQKMLDRVLWFYNTCVIKRVLQSAEDIKVVCGFIRVLFMFEIPFVNVLVLLDKIFECGFSLVFFVSDEEAKNLGNFVGELVGFVWGLLANFEERCSRNSHLFAGRQLSKFEIDELAKRWGNSLDFKIRAALFSEQKSVVVKALFFLVGCKCQFIFNDTVISKLESMISERDLQIRRLVNQVLDDLETNNKSVKQIQC
ncbi:hypothetical protein EIN_129340 [Entamoeba invadens IP1]|uniref:THO complex subunitTHOC2 C-terminal domain-containing protein n=1 Tax=Entamoeba invadens IP1 TaxID=370355 RepID=L7FN85_ENTIV|nr:hypothetical protein EIN_129340 [Entamoeba invadens IP1]ELP91594.1 hypothetical protein EIN_129340 [Entamoeba invadens IP1]|eukprot:XP_004258365.1 hypothetical protein EIN_129340 [Entamoeba invadens IP1]